jgi:hypothetical protein
VLAWNRLYLRDCVKSQVIRNRSGPRAKDTITITVRREV